MTNVELCRARTSDGLLLEGALASASVGLADDEPVDAFLLLHGTGGNFHAPGVLEEFAERAVADGIAALRANTRGHDLMASIPGPNGTVRGGAAFEDVADCVHDVRAWVDLLVGRGYRRVGVVGHSLGGVKAVYSAAVDPSVPVVRIVGISPPRFHHANLQSHPLAEPFREDFARATQRVAEGRGDELLVTRQPLPIVLTADGFLAKYGPHDDFDYVRHLPHVRVPTLIVIGTGSCRSSPAFDGTPGAVAEVAATNDLVSLEVVDDANTGYAGCTEVPFERVAEWLHR